MDVAQILADANSELTVLSNGIIQLQDGRDPKLLLAEMAAAELKLQNIVYALTVVLTPTITKQVAAHNALMRLRNRAA